MAWILRLQEGLRGAGGLCGSEHLSVLLSGETDLGLFTAPECSENRADREGTGGFTAKTCSSTCKPAKWGEELGEGERARRQVEEIESKEIPGRKWMAGRALFPL